METRKIINELVDTFQLNNIVELSKKLGYSSPSAIYMMLGNDDNRGISENFVSKVGKAFPEVNEDFLRGKSNRVLKIEIKGKPTSHTYTLNDLPILFIDMIREQKKTNELLEKLLDK